MPNNGKKSCHFSLLCCTGDEPIQENCRYKVNDLNPFHRSSELCSHKSNMLLSHYYEEFNGHRDKTGICVSACVYLWRACESIAQKFACNWLNGPNDWNWAADYHALWLLSQIHMVHVLQLVGLMHSLNEPGRKLRVWEWIQNRNR